MQPTRSLTNSVSSVTLVSRIKTLTEKEYTTDNVFWFSLQVLLETFFTVVYSYRNVSMNECNFLVVHSRCYTDKAFRQNS